MNFQTEEPLLQSEGVIKLKKPVAIPVEVEITPLNKLHEKLQLHGLAPAKKTFSIPELSIGTCAAISRLFLSIKPDILSTGNIVIDNSQAFERHAGTFAQIIAVAAANQGGDYSKRLHRLILKEFSTKSLSMVMHQVINQMNIMHYMAAMFLLNGVLPEEEKVEPESDQP